MTTLETFIDVCKHTKESAVAAATNGEIDDVPPFVEFHRDGEPFMLFITAQIDRDMALTAIMLGVPIFAIDEMYLMFDAHMSREMNNPATGKPWGPGGMQKACDEDGACSLGVITDCLTFMSMTRDGEVSMANVPYHVDKTNHVVCWHDDEFRATKEEGAVKLEGLVPDRIRDAFAAPPFRDSLEPELAVFSDDPDAPCAQDVADLMGAHLLAEYGAPMMAITPDRRARLDRIAALMGMAVSNVDDESLDLIAEQRHNPIADLAAIRADLAE